MPRMLGEKVDENRSADGMADDHPTAAQDSELFFKRNAPYRIARNVFIGHPRIANLVTLSEIKLQVLRKFAVPLVMNARSTALDEKYLAFHSQVPRARVFVVVL